MNVSDIIAKTDEAFGGPVGLNQLASDLTGIGIQTGDVLLVHSSLSSIGWITGGAETLIRTLLRSIGTSGTLVMPAHSGALSDPVHWENPPVPSSWHNSIREEMPPFSKELTPTRGLGAVPELFRRFPSVTRSSHPMDSFCALGPEAGRICANHSLESGLGEDSPLARLYELNARVLLIGCGYDSNTSLHLAEHRADWPGKKRIRQGCPVFEEGRRVWKEFEELDYDTDDFSSCGRAFEESPAGREEAAVFSRGRIGLAESRLISQPALVDFAADWFTSNRQKPEAST